MKKETRHNKNENLYNYLSLAKATEEKLLQMAEKVEEADKVRQRFIKKDIEETKKRCETVTKKL